MVTRIFHRKNISRIQIQTRIRQICFLFTSKLMRRKFINKNEQRNYARRVQMRIMRLAAWSPVIRFLWYDLHRISVFLRKVAM